MRVVEHSKEFKGMVVRSISSINNQFITCMKVAVVKSLELYHVNDLS